MPLKKFTNLNLNPIENLGKILGDDDIRARKPTTEICDGNYKRKETKSRRNNATDS